MPAKKIKIISVSDAASAMSSKSAADNAKANNKSRSHFMLGLYWLIIAAFVATACYMMSRFGSGVATRDNVQVVESAMPEEEPLRAVPDMSIEYRESGKNKLISGDTVGALNDFTIAVERNPNEPMNYIFRGEALMSGSNFDAAIQDFSNAIRLDGSSVAAYYDRSLANIKLENLAAAKSDLDSAIRALDSNGETNGITARDIYAKRAQVNLWLRNWVEAEGDYTASIAKNTGELDWNDYTGRAEARTNKGDYDLAIADYVSAVTIISERIQKTPGSTTRENMSRQAMGFFEKSGALRVKVGQMELALQDLQAAHTLAIALDDMENKNRLQILMSSIK